MASFRYNDFSDSPTIFFPHSFPQHHPHTLNNVFHSPQSHSIYQSSSSQRYNQPPAFNPYPPSASTLPAKNTRKRSRDDLDDADKDDHYGPLTEAPAAALLQEKPQPSFIYGEGMTLINPDNGLAVSAESQTGTWYEDQLELECRAAAKAAEALAHEQAQAVAAAAQLPPRRKCLRMVDEPSSVSLLALSSSSPTSIITSSSSSSSSSLSSSLSTSPTSTPFFTSSSPPIDLSPSTIASLLGIRWTPLPASDSPSLGAARGWARFIEKHFAPRLTDVTILLRSSADEPCCLVRAAQGFFLFREDLSAGRLVAREWVDCVANLNAAPAQFEGEAELRVDDGEGVGNESRVAREEEEAMTDLGVVVGMEMNVGATGLGMEMEMETGTDVGAQATTATAAKVETEAGTEAQTDVQAHDGNTMMLLD